MILFCTDNKRENIRSIFNIYFGIDSLHFSASAKIFRGTVDDKLNFTSHIKNLLKETYIMPTSSY